MTNTLNILDFEDNGRAIIEIPKIQHDYSFVLNHWQDIERQLEEIEDDLACCNTEERQRFLEKTKKLLLERREKSKDCDSDEYDENEMDEADLKLSEPYIQLDVECDEDEVYLCVYHFRLKHSLAWYLMKRLNHEIAMIDRQIENASVLLKIWDNEYYSRKAITIIKESDCVLTARNRLMKEFQLSEIQAEYILSTKLSTTKDSILRNLNFYATAASLLRDLKKE